MTMNNTIITSQLVPDNLRMKTVNDLFGFYFPMRIEPFVFAMAEEMGHEYRGGMWQFYTLSNHGMYLAPDFDGNFSVSCENGFSGQMSADALGITCCLYAFSHLSFSDNEGLSKVCTRHFHLLREFALDHPKAASIFQATD
jgi:hypothetical protein